jgi:5,10-methylenetetrahydrofolate reductase
MNNEVPGASVPAEILERMRKKNSKEEAFYEGVEIAKETYQHVRSEVNGVQLAAPLGRVDAVMMVLED